MLHRDPLVLRLLLATEGLNLLVRNLALRQDAHKVFRQDYVLDVHAPRLDLVLVELRFDVRERLLLHLLTRLDEFDRGHALQFVAEMVADRRLQDLADQVAHRANHRDHARRLRVRHVNLHLQVDPEDKSLS